MSIEDAERFVVEFVDWYNNEHLHSGLDLLPPCAVHFGYHQEIGNVYFLSQIPLRG